jgi:hypothetical protein
MQYRETINKKLDAIDGNIRKLDFLIKRGGVPGDILQLLEATKELNNEVRSYVARENFSGSEINKV